MAETRELHKGFILVKKYLLYESLGRKLLMLERVRCFLCKLSVMLPFSISMRIPRWSRSPDAAVPGTAATGRAT